MLEPRRPSKYIKYMLVLYKKNTNKIHQPLKYILQPVLITDRCTLSSSGKASRGKTTRANLPPARLSVVFQQRNASENLHLGKAFISQSDGFSLILLTNFTQLPIKGYPKCFSKFVNERFVFI